ncbi:uncharacterized protein B0H64DRAFT_373082 [Chaetomium fimeti]|uniref:Uncharacterized protein n=1 Tax=Chaetomium fimeti TaxID=1854472 RepID=A0AAE0HJK5_9PEZI|nr:hypothetical protein B0H64DRAFT_373082 [Chaetomium fimeti]
MESTFQHRAAPSMGTDDMEAPEKIRESQILTTQAIKDIEQSLGDVGRGADFPMSRTRGGSTSSRGSANSIPPPPTRSPPIPAALAQNRRTPRVPDVLSGNSLPLPKTRPSRSRCASAPGNQRQLGSLAPIDEGRSGHSRGPVPPLPNRSPISALPSAPRAQQEEWLQEEWQQEVSRQLAQSVGGRSRPARTPSTPAPYVAPTYSLFPPPQSLPVSPPPPRLVPSAPTAHRSAVSISSSPGWRYNESPQPSLLRDLEPDSPYGYPAPPPFLHNWETPNRPSAVLAVNPASAHRAGQTGPPVGSRPRPRPTPRPVAAATMRPAPAAVAPSFLPGPFVAAAVSPAPISISLPTLAPTVGPIRAPVRAPAPAPAPVQAQVPGVRDSSVFSTGRFTYYPVMSPYEAEAALGSGGAELGVYQHVSGAEPEEQRVDGDPSEMDARMFPLLDHDLMSADQAAAAVAEATRVRNTMFIDRGFDVEGISRASYYGDEGEGVLEAVEGVEDVAGELGKARIYHVVASLNNLYTRDEPV